MSDKTKIKGGQFLVSDIENIYTPELFNEEQKMMAQSCQDFLDTEVLDKLDRIDSMEEGLMPSLMDKAGEMGLLSISLPEKYGGFGGDFNTSLLTVEVLGGGHSFAVALAAHTGIGTLPILYFGTEAQKEHYLPKLASGEWKASYCLTEPGSGSDALSAKTRADLTPDGKHYVLNGQKMWITNAGFADVFVVFAQIDGDKFTGFIVDKGTEGLSLGNEEHKMGIKGSSTRQVFFQDCKVPVENLLGEIGKGHLIAFNILNIGRIKLAAAALGASKAVIRHAISYANERVQFKLPIARFGAIQHKLAQQAIEIFATESALYRASSDINAMEQELVAGGMPYEQAIQEAAKEFAIECALLKVSGSETLDFVADEGVQILGGYGFSADFPMDKAYRDSRINRIFEGTNEINRLLIIDMFFKKAMKGELDLMGPAMKIQAELMSIPDFGNSEATLFSEEEKAIKNIKKAALMVAGAAAQKFMQKLSHEQEIIMNVSDIIIQLYQAESALVRTKAMVAAKGEKEAEAYIAMTKTYIYDVVDKVNKYGKDAINSFATGDEQRMMLLGLKRFTKIAPFNTKDARRLIATKMIEANKFVF
jgi:alkylation response protein AidB-like acyl-CoA dehydrogenase